MSKNIDQIAKNAAKKQPRRKLHDFEIESFYGKEPTWEGVSNTDDDFKLKVHYAFNWINATFEYEEIKQEALAYLISVDRSTEKLNELPATKFAYIGKIAWLLNNGCPLNEQYLTSFENGLKQLLDAQESDDVVITETGEILIEDTKAKVSRSEVRLRNQTIKISDMFGIIENIIDESVMTDTEINESVIYHKLISDKVDVKIADELYEKLLNKHRILSNELQNVQNLSEDEQIAQFDDVEIYQNYVANVEANINAFVSATNQVASYLGNKKALKKSERKIGKHKVKKIETQISKMNFKVQDETYKVMSINPALVIGAMTLLVFNSHTRKLAIYVAKDETGLGVKGTTIQNFDEVLSVQKIVKKPDMLKQFQEGNVRRLKVLFRDNIKAKESPANGRMNEHSILLKVYKEKYSPTI